MAGHKMTAESRKRMHDAALKYRNNGVSLLDYAISRGGGETLSEMARDKGVSRQSVSQFFIRAKERGMLDVVKEDPVLVKLVQHLDSTANHIRRCADSGGKHSVSYHRMRTQEDDTKRIETVVRAMKARLGGATEEMVAEIMVGAPN